MLLVLLFARAAISAQPSRCQPADPCWPSAADIESLRAALDPAAARSLVYQGPSSTFPCAVPVDSPGDQPLYGAGASLAELYVQSDTDRNGTCFVDGFAPEYCLIGTLNAQLEEWQPAFIAWPLTPAHVQTLVRFATKHNLAICVAGTGHDFLNRHSCDRGLLIRTSLLKGVSWAAGDTELRLGAGSTWSEAHKAAAERGRLVASGWSVSVGIAGWTTGGGRGPLSPSLGLGVDNLVEAELVTADGSLVTVNALGTRSVSLDGSVTVSNSTDLFWALRGGGGSTWGVLTALTLRTHPLPAGGLTYAEHLWAGNMCNGLDDLHASIDLIIEWSQQLDSKWGPCMYVIPLATPDGVCPATWIVAVLAIFNGPIDSTSFETTWSALLNGAPRDGTGEVSSHVDMWDFLSNASPEYINPIAPKPSVLSAAGVPSILVARERVASGDLSAFVKRQMALCAAGGPCIVQSLLTDVTGLLESPQPAGTAISSSFRTAHTFLVANLQRTEMEEMYTLGDKTYFSESAYDMPEWKTRLWDADDYEKLLEVKRQVDPRQVFWCRHCIGDEEEFTQQNISE